ncbi:CRTAC1 family protein [Nocardiopsis rhodophaea]|uniref:CRTAC1 family protein n=1 Tax=Nocardiopsis rhodophaea TaxID=280238 RepID=A0ABP5DX73_9ACTN
MSTPASHRIPRGPRRHIAKAVAVLLILAAGLVTRLPEADLGDPARLQQRFAFERHQIASVAVDGRAEQRTVQPALTKIAAWLSGVGAGVALTDVSGEGRSADVCLSDPRTDTVTVSPAAGTGTRYSPFVLDPAPLPYDRDTMAPMGCLPADFTGDGRIDLLVYYWGRSPVLFLRAEDGTPRADAFVPTELVADGPDATDTGPPRWYTNAATTADVDGDGRLDLVVGNYFPDGARLLDPRAEGDAAMAMNDSMSRARNGGVNRLFRMSSATPGDRPEVVYEEVEDVFPADDSRAWTLAVGAHDLDGDLLPELYFGNDFGPDRLYRNDSTPGDVRLTPLSGEGGFTVPDSKVLGNDSFKGMGIDFADMTGDGRTDMVVSNISTSFGLMESHYAWVNTGGGLDSGTAPFRDDSDRLGVARTGWGWDVKFGDFDNDTTPELVQATGFVKGERDLWPQIAEMAMANDDLLKDDAWWPEHTTGWDLAGHQDDVLFVRAADGRWGDIGPLIGLDDQGVTRGVAVADVDGDGRLDFALARQWEASYLYRNTAAATGAALNLRLLLPPRGDEGDRVEQRLASGAEGEEMTGSPAVGATATVRLPDGRKLTSQVDGGNGHSGANAPELHFGLGDLPAGTELPVHLEWRDRDGAEQQTDLALTPGRWSVRLAGGAP